MDGQERERKDLEKEKGESREEKNWLFFVSYLILLRWSAQKCEGSRKRMKPLLFSSQLFFTFR